ncbi:MAG: alpha/beta hydrolase, partial [Treponemataceae bacterium]|nr:alpha/beta hydrolase [Treponemataceae bacterium]
RFDDIQYGKSEKWNVLDIYRPKSADQSDLKYAKLPVLINVHGGGWVYGDKELYQFYCMSLAQKGFAVVNYTYGLAPDFHAPSQFKDLNDVIIFVFENADEYGLNTEKIFMMGDSAGANLAAFYSCICTDGMLATRFSENPQKKYNFAPPSGFIPKALLLNCGIYDFSALMNEKGGFIFLTQNLVRDYLGKLFPSKKLLASYSPVNYINQDFPPCFIMGANKDSLCAQIPLLAAKLDEAGVSYTTKIYGTEENPQNHVFHCDIKNPVAKICNDEEIEFLKGF